MTLALSEEQKIIQNMAADFAKTQFQPHAADWDAQQHFPIDAIRAAAELGFGSIYTSADKGGAGLSRFDAVLVFEQLSQACPSTAAFISIHNMVTWMVDCFASETLRAKYVPSMANMQLITSYCLTEPGSGSDAASLKTKAVRDGETYRLTGTKQFISGAGVSDIYLVMARTQADNAPDTADAPNPANGADANGISAFLLEKDTPGLSFGANEKKMGWKSQPTRQVIMDEAVVPAENLIGKEGDGFKFAMAGLDGGRLNIAACSLGGAQAAFQQALAYVKERNQFGRAIADFQTTQFKLADMETGLQAARLMLYQAAQKLDAQAPDATKWCAMAKQFVTDYCFDIANMALQLHGGYGYLSEYNIERIVRDLRVHQILEGTNEIMRVILARNLLERNA
ncbi:MAG: acyl-CoA dehydrogenase family protein [Alphaproteobacteria bacterium]|nr:acyl-CoA dehydrogenase family protein [Alphaproteobacteria bacterium]